MSGEGARYGKEAESTAERYLRRKGFRILDRNARSVYGELDLVAEQGDTVVFIEVKARRTGAYGGVSYAVDARKQARLIRLAANYLAQRRWGHRSCRFDVILCRGDEAKPDAIEHIENAFDVPGDHHQW